MRPEADSRSSDVHTSGPENRPNAVVSARHISSTVAMKNLPVTVISAIFPARDVCCKQPRSSGAAGSSEPTHIPASGICPVAGLAAGSDPSDPGIEQGLQTKRRDSSKSLGNGLATRGRHFLRNRFAQDFSAETVGDDQSAPALVGDDLAGENPGPPRNRRNHRTPDSPAICDRP